MTPAAIQRTLESGIMKTQAAPLSADERLKIANSSRHGRHCRTAARGNREPVSRRRRMDRRSGAGPVGAAGLANTRFQSAKDAGFQADDLARLKLKWAFAFPDTSTLRSQPAVYRGRVFVGGQDGSVYALDAATGCVHWSTTVQSQVRSGITVGEIAR